MRSHNGYHHRKNAFSCNSGISLSRRSVTNYVAKLAGTTQARISAFENEPERTKLETLFKILAGLELELIVQPRKKSSDTARSIKEPTATYDDDEAW